MKTVFGFIQDIYTITTWMISFFYEKAKDLIWDVKAEYKKDK
jgi:hypothetical protein